jgi:anti-sigma factor ChrR (cupin superfamily)
MREHDRAELGAHVLGLLDGASARAVEAHIAVCWPCRQEWEELRAMAELLDEVPPEALLEGPPDGDLVLQRTLRQMRAETRAARRRRLVGGAAAAAAALAVVLGGGVLVGRATAPEPSVLAQPPAPGGTVLIGTGPGGAELTATVTPAAGWVRLTATVDGVPAGQRCRLVVVARNGTRAVAGSWLVSPAGEHDGTTMHGSAIVAPDQVAAVLVENEAGREFVVAPA